MQEPAVQQSKPETQHRPDLEMGSTPQSEHSAPADTEYDFRPFDWKRFFLSPKYLPWHILMIVVGVLTGLLVIYHDQVVEQLTSPSPLQVLRPFSEKVRDLPAGWLIPIVILIIISFPPLFGHEVVALLCGVVYGLWFGFGIVAAGTFLGEVGTWFAFKSLLRQKAVKMERTNLNYASLARLTRDGGFWIVFWIRFSIIPSHFSTAVFATCDVKFWHFAVATFLTLPKQIILVYLGVLLVAEKEGNVIQNAVLGVTFAVTIFVGVIIYKRMRTAKATLRAEQMKRKRQMAGHGTDDVESNDGSIPLVYQHHAKPTYAPTIPRNESPMSEDRYWRPQDSVTSLPGQQHKQEAREWL
ncbi:Tlg2-vesicle protein [Apiospora saccharicola]|uniref:Golgi apparatus membrane protein TVP38 n=1 Tax=Apiospora saccharicola TaxID=335842 RepID=A0ABR1WJ60_9PEZI